MPEEVVPAHSMPAKRRVLLIFGGRSAEHDVSRVTAVAVARALDPERYDVVPLAITTDGQWLLADSARAALDAGAGAFPDAFLVDGAHAAGLGELVALSGSTPPGSKLAARASLDVDVVLPLLHGPYGEDGTVQGLLELANLPYVGSGVVGSAVAMDKVMMKRAFAACGLATARHLPFRDGGDIGAFLDAVEAELGYPCFVKPANLGSSVGVSKAVDRASLVTACAVALDFDEWILVEEAITGREIEVAVLGDDPPEASVPGEIVPGAEFYTYADKYEHDDAQLHAPAVLSEEQARAAQELAVAAFEACRCEAMARVDLFFEEIGPSGAPGRGFLVNEVNTIPGFTPISMYPRLWEVSGLSYSALLDRLIDLAIERHDRRARRAGRQRGIDLQVHHRAGEGAGDAVDGLDLRDDLLAEVVERRRGGVHDHVVGPRHRRGGDDAVDAASGLRDLHRLPDLGLDQHVRGDAHPCLRSWQLRCRAARATARCAAGYLRRWPLASGSPFPRRWG